MTGKRLAFFAGRALPRLGGSELVVDSLAREFTKRGADVSVVAPRPSWFSFPKDSEFPYPVRRYPPHLSKRYFNSFYKSFFLKACFEKRFDIIHCHELYPHLSYALEAKRKVGSAVVVTSHGPNLFPREGRLGGHRIRRELCQMFAEVDAFVSLSDPVRDAFLRAGVSSERIWSIPNGVCLASCESDSMHSCCLPTNFKKNTYALFLGRFSKRKGADLLLSAYAQIPSSTRIPLVVAGYGREEKKLRNLGQPLGVYFAGPVFGARKKSLLKNALVTVVPTRSWEACSLVALESLAAGTAVLVTDVPGLGHLVSPGETGYRVLANSISDLKAALVDVFHNRELLTKMGVRARESVQGYSWEDIADAHRCMYEKVW